MTSTLGVIVFTDGEPLCVPAFHTGHVRRVHDDACLQTGAVSGVLGRLEDASPSVRHITDGLLIG